MVLERIATIALPPHAKEGGFDHAAVDAGRARLYIAHTANAAIEAVDCEALRYLHWLPGLPGFGAPLVPKAAARASTWIAGQTPVAAFGPPARRPTGRQLA